MEWVLFWGAFGGAFWRGAFFGPCLRRERRLKTALWGGELPPCWLGLSASVSVVPIWGWVGLDAAGSRWWAPPAPIIDAPTSGPGRREKAPRGKSTRVLFYPGCFLGCFSSCWGAFSRRGCFFFATWAAFPKKAPPAKSRKAPLHPPVSVQRICQRTTRISMRHGPIPGAAY